MKKQLLVVLAILSSGVLMAPRQRHNSVSGASSSTSSRRGTCSFGDIPCDPMGGLVCQFLSPIDRASLGATSKKYREIGSVIRPDWNQAHLIGRIAGGDVEMAGFSPNGSQLIFVRRICGPEGRDFFGRLSGRDRVDDIFVYDLQNNVEMATNLSFGVASNFALSKDRKKLYTIITEDRRIKAVYFEISTGQRQEIFIDRDRSIGQRLFRFFGLPDFSSIDVSPDGQLILIDAASEDGVSLNREAMLFDLNGSLINKFPADYGCISSIKFSNDGQRFIRIKSRRSSFSVVAEIFNIKSGRRLLRLGSDEERIFCASFSRDGNEIVTASSVILPEHARMIMNARNPYIPQIKIWDAFTGACKGAFYVSRDKGLIKSIDISPDGQRIAIGYGSDASSGIDIWQAKLNYSPELSLTAVHKSSRRCTIM